MTANWIQTERAILLAALVFAFLFVGARVLKELIWKFLERIASRTEQTWDEQLLVSLHGPANFISLVLAFLGTAWFAAREEPKLYTPLSIITKFSIILLAFWSLERVLNVLVQTNRLPIKLEASSKALALTISRILIFALASLVILDTAGISITPVLASLGIGSLAVALALQDTLSNFFSGVYLLADQPIRLGDFVQTEDGSQGTVIKVAWRNTQILTPQNHVLVIPNSKLASSRITNFDLINSEAAVSVSFGISYDSDLNRVEQVSLSVAREIQEQVRGAVKTFHPLLRFNTFADSAIMVEVILRANSIADASLLKHEFIKAIHSRFKSEKLEIPLPQRVVAIQPSQSIPKN